MKHRQPAILVVDDEIAFHDLVRVIFGSTREVVGVTGVEEALRLLRKGDIGIVLLDVHLPTRSGLDLLQVLSRSPSAPPVIVVTADTSSRISRQAEMLGAVNTVSKPIVPRQLRRMVDFCENARRYQPVPA